LGRRVDLTPPSRVRVGNWTMEKGEPRNQYFHSTSVRNKENLRPKGRPDRENGGITQTKTKIEGEKTGQRANPNGEEKWTIRTGILSRT